jgi:hypothetical protein
MIAAGPPPSAGPLRPSGGFPRPGRRTLIIIGGLVAAGVIAAAIVAIIIANVQEEQRTTTSEAAPELDFVKFEVERQEVRVGEATSILFNVQNSGERVIEDARVVIAIEPEAGRNYLSISNGTVELPALSTNARSGDVKVTITATGTPAREAVYLVKGSVYAEDAIADAREFQLTIRQQ